MMYRVEIQSGALEVAKRLPTAVRAAISDRIDALAENPRPPGTAPLPAGYVGTYRVRVAGQCMMGYEVDDWSETVTVWVIGRREEMRGRGRDSG